MEKQKKHYLHMIRLSIQRIHEKPQLKVIKELGKNTRDKINIHASMGFLSEITN